MDCGEDMNDLKCRLELVVEKSPNTILVLDKDLRMQEVVVAKDDFYRDISKIAIGKRPEDVFSDEKTLSEYAGYRVAIHKVLEEQVSAEFTYEVEYKGKNYYYLSQIVPYKEGLVIVYVRNIGALKGQKDLNELINTILDRLPLGVFVKDAENHFNYLYWNHFMEEITGIQTAVIEGRDDTEINYDAFISEDLKRKTDDEIMKSGVTTEFNGRVVAVSGESKDIEVTKFPVYLSSGKPLLLGLWRDVTACNEAEKALKRTRILTKIALKSSDIRTCSIFVNPNSKNDYTDSVVSLNNWDSTDETMVEIPWPMFAGRVHPEDRNSYLESFKSLSSGQISDYKVEVRMMYPGSKEYCWRESTTYIYERDNIGRPTVILGCSTNIQERKDQEISLEEARNKAEMADKMKSKYLADMSHEIRTPLNAITGFSELMAFADTDEERMSYYNFVKTNNQLLMQLINDILDLSKIEADAIKISYALMDVNDLMDTLYASAKLRIPENVELILEKGAESYLFGTDSNRLLQLVNNLLNNAIKNTKEGSITMGYTCLPDGQLRFYVKDTGVGIAEDKLNGIFNRFVKINDYVEGIGLGLAICRGLVAKMDGSIHVESELGVGSTFSFVLPTHEPDEIEPLCYRRVP